MLSSPRPKPIGEAQEILFVHGVEHLDYRTLDDLVFQRCYSERPLPPVGLRDVRDLVPRAAQGLGLTAPGAPLRVRVVFGEPLIQGAPNVYFGFPLGVAAVFAVFVAIFWGIDRLEARRIDLVCHGALAPGVIEYVSIQTIRHLDTWIVHFAFETAQGVQRGQQRIAASQLEGALVALGLTRTPTAGDPIVVAYDPRAPRRRTLYSLDATPDPSDPPVPGPLPPELQAAPPRALPPGAPTLATEVPVGVLVLLLSGGLLFGIGPLVYAALATRAGDAAEALMVGEMMFLLLAAFAAPLCWSAVVRPRVILRTGAPLAAFIRHVSRGKDGDAARVWVSFTAHTPSGVLHGRASLRARRLQRMCATPRAGDTVLLVADRARTWDRVIWGFCAPTDPAQ